MFASIAGNGRVFAASDFEQHARLGQGKGALRQGLIEEAYPARVEPVEVTYFRDHCGALVIQHLGSSLG
jgi:hypothetical protein